MRVCSQVSKYIDMILYKHVYERICIIRLIYIYIYIYILSSTDSLFRSIRTLQCG